MTEHLLGAGTKALHRGKAGGRGGQTMQDEEREGSGQ